jgi:seryl-tRNA synthetase
MTTQLQGIGEYVKRLEKIAEECGDKVQKDAAQKDEFLRHKKRCYDLLEQVREDILERQTILKRRGNCYETIQKGNHIRQQLAELKGTVPKLQQLHKKAEKRWGASKRQGELSERFQAIRLLNRQVKEADELFISCNAAGSDASAALLLGSNGSGPAASLFGNLRHAAAEEDTKRDLTGEEKDAIDKIRGRDADIDKEIDGVGKVVDRLQDMAENIGRSAERQKIAAEGLTTDVIKADDDLKELNKKVTEIRKYEKNTNFCCQMVLVIGLLCCTGFIFQQLRLV